MLDNTDEITSTLSGSEQQQQQEQEPEPNQEREDGGESTKTAIRDGPDTPREMLAEEKRYTGDSIRHTILGLSRGDKITIRSEEDQFMPASYDVQEEQVGSLKLVDENGAYFELWPDGLPLPGTPSSDAWLRWPASEQRYVSVDELTIENLSGYNYND